MFTAVVAASVAFPCAAAAAAAVTAAAAAAVAVAVAVAVVVAIVVAVAVPSMLVWSGLLLISLLVTYSFACTDPETKAAAAVLVAF